MLLPLTVHLNALVTSSVLYGVMQSVLLLTLHYSMRMESRDVDILETYDTHAIERHNQSRWLTCSCRLVGH